MGHPYAKGNDGGWLRKMRQADKLSARHDEPEDLGEYLATVMSDPAVMDYLHDKYIGPRDNGSLVSE